MKTLKPFPAIQRRFPGWIIALVVLCLCAGMLSVSAESFAQTTTNESTATQKGDSTQKSLTASLLTCAPGDESYELYGHTALRLRSDDGEMDVVYNYGYFNFKRPNFVWHFILGETDYSLRAMTWEHFYTLYTDEGRWIDEQTLSLTPEETGRLAMALETNRWEATQHDWTYRYNYFTDNCTTRAIDQIRAAIKGKLHLPKAATTTYRQSLHQYTAGHPWSQLGNDMLLGATADDSIDASQQLFLPIEARDLLAETFIEDQSGTQRPLVKGTKRIATFPEKPADTSLPPVFWALLLLTLTIGITAYEGVKKKTLWGYDVSLITIQGLAGCLIAFMLCFSSHPSVDSNLLISWLNPLPLFFLWTIVKRFRAENVSRFFVLQIAMIGVFAIASIMRFQQFPPETYVLALCLLIRAVWLLRNKNYFMKV